MSRLLLYFHIILKGEIMKQLTAIEIFDFEKKFNNNEFQDWNIDSWGYLVWSDIEEFCRKKGLKEILKVFKFNEGQIYPKE